MAMGSAMPVTTPIMMALPMPPSRSVTVIRTAWITGLDPDSDNDGLPDGQDPIAWLREGILVIERLLDESVRLTWPGSGFILQWSERVQGPWQNLYGQTSPFLANVAGPSLPVVFYR